MKRINGALTAAFSLCLAALLLLSACGNPAPTPEPDNAPLPTPAAAPPSDTQEPSPADDGAEPQKAEWRQLSAEELDELTENLDYNENGFFVCTYYRPEEIDWGEVFYNGAGIALDETEELRAEYEKQNGEIICDLTIVSQSDAEKYVWDKTGTKYSEARRPLTWPYLYDSNAFAHDHGDTNIEIITFTDGWVNGDEYRLRYERDDWRTGISQREFELTAYIRNYEWQYVSNLPTDAAAPITLLNVDFFETKEDAQKAGDIAEFVETDPMDDPDSDPLSFRWAVITAQEDNVRFCVDRAVINSDIEDILRMEYALNIPDENITSGVLNAGERIAVYLPLSWYPTYRIMATKDAYYGDYWVGEDNWLHMGNDVTRYIAGHDLESEGLGCKPENLMQLINFLSDGDWVYFDPDTGDTRAAVRFFDYCLAEVITEDRMCSLYVDYDNLYSDSGDAPDLLVLSRSDYNDYSDWSALPDWYTIDSLGDYVCSAVQMDGEQILTLTQANNGDAALGYLLGAGENAHEFTFVRYKGTDIFEGQG